VTAAAGSGSAAPAWARAYRPLRPRTLLIELVALVVAEVLLFRSYFHHEAGFHWATHFLVGLTAAAVVNAVWLALKGAPARGQMLWVLALHLYAMFPDLLFSPGLIPHDGWMNVFLGHISSHYVPGGDATWLLVALLASGAYATLLSAWLAARRVEADAGLAPAIGVGGSALLRAQTDPRTKPLAHTRFGPDGPPQVLLLHGLGASGAIWREVVAELERRDTRGLVPDLLGFGASREIGTQFDLDAHVEALTALLERHNGPALVVVGHSFGCAAAAGLARRVPERVAALLLVSPPVFRDADRARERLGHRGWLAKRVLDGSPVASVTCGLMCLARPLAANVAARVARELPERVARDSVQHSWPAYRDALMTLLEANPLPQAIAHPSRPTTVVVSDADEETPAEDVTDWPHDAVELVELDGDHLLPLRRPQPLAELIGEQARTY
jgi:pimeloyl-ACP methyl ester carboxylesterase